ncbi:BTB/POZ domain-containing protein 9 [Mactra antiquata]
MTGDNILPILYGAKKYCLSELVDRCALFLTESLSYDNVCTIYDQAKMYNMKDVAKASFDFMVENSSHVCQSDSSICLSHSSMLAFLSSEHLTGDELDHFKFANKWANQNCLSNGMKPTPENKRKVLGDIVKKISYQLIKTEDFAHIVVPTNILSAEEQSQLFQFIATRNNSCIENFSLPPRPGFPVTIDTRGIGGKIINEENFIFQFSCNTNVRLVKLSPLCLEKVGGIEVCMNVNSSNASSLTIAKQTDVLDDSGTISKDLGITFIGNTENIVKITRRSQSPNTFTRTYDDAYEDGDWFNVCDKQAKDMEKLFQTAALSKRHERQERRRQMRNRMRRSTCIPTRDTNFMFTNGGFTCLIMEIPVCVETVEFKILAEK